MKYRVSFFRKSEVVAGRAPRYMQDIDVDLATLDQSQSITDAIKTKMESEEDGLVVRSVYKTPENIPIRKKPSYVFESAAARNKWYSSHKSTQKERHCHECQKNEVERYKRLCTECREKREKNAAEPTPTERSCNLCHKTIPPPSRRRYCDDCAAKRKESQEKFHREKRAKQTTIERIREQIAWAEEKLLTTTLKSCKLSSRFQGLRIPHIMEDENGVSKNRCRTCLQKFIDVQTVYLSNLMVEEQDNSAFVTSLLEPERAAGHAAGL